MKVYFYIANLFGIEDFKISTSMKKLIHFLLFFVILLINIDLMSQNRLTGKPFATRSEVIANNGIAATSQPLCTQVAIDILKKGGNQAIMWMKKTRYIMELLSQEKMGRRLGFSLTTYLRKD